MKDENFILSLEEFEYDKYKNIENDRLILFAVSFLAEKKIEVTFDKVVMTVFKLFPRKFSLIGFSDYPDGKRVHDCLFHCTYHSKKWLIGNAKSGYKLTEKGTYFLEETKKMLEGKIKMDRKYNIAPKRKELIFIEMLKKTNAYKKYIEGRLEDITNSDILESLKSPNDSKEIIKNYLKKYLEYAERLGDISSKEFLEFIKKRIDDDKNA